MARNKALKILFETYWSRSGWKPEQTVSNEDYVYARDAGYMFEPVELNHDKLICWLKASFSGVSPEKAGNAFLASLSTRQLEIRSALGSYAIARYFPYHTYRGDEFCCAICGTFKNPIQPYDLSMLNFERFKWGGVLHERPEYVAFDLEQFKKLEGIEPTQRDFDILWQIIEAARRCEPTAKPRELEKRLASLLDSNKAEREVLIQILAYCGILHSAGHPGYLESFINYSERSEPTGNRYWTYPISWWRGVNGINQKALEYFFPELA